MLIDACCEASLNSPGRLVITKTQFYCWGQGMHCPYSSLIEQIFGQETQLASFHLHEPDSIVARPALGVAWHVFLAGSHSCHQ